MSKPVPVKNLSKSGISFALNENPDHGETILMQITFPDGTHFKLKGHIRWLNPLNNDENKAVGIQFFPFGNSKYYNPTNALDYLRTMDGQSMVQAAYSEELN